VGGAIYGGAVAVLIPHSGEGALLAVLVLAVAPLAFIAAINPSLNVATVTAIIVLLLPMMNRCRRAGDLAGADRTADYAVEVAALRSEGLIRCQPGDVAERFFALGFSLEQMRQNLKDLERCVAEWAETPAIAAPVAEE
jgi:hypothetical protein